MRARKTVKARKAREKGRYVRSKRRKEHRHVGDVRHVGHEVT